MICIKNNMSQTLRDAAIGGAKGAETKCAIALFRFFAQGGAT
jgi:hypothetical protein